MGLGTTAKKLQSLVDLAETLAEQIKSLRNRIVKLEAAADETHDRVAALEEELTYQQALVEAIAAEHDIDPAEYTPDTSESAEDDQATT